MTATYIVLLHGDEEAWEARDDADIARNHANHQEFARQAPRRGHTIVGGEELQRARTSIVVRRSPDGWSLVDGPFTETVEQLGGFYAVRTDDVQDLAALVGDVLEETAEIRPVVDHSMDDTLGAKGAAAAAV